MTGQDVRETSQPGRNRDRSRNPGAPAAVRRDRRAGPADRAAGLDAGRLPPVDGPPDRPARALGDHRHAARGRLGHPRAVAAPQGDPAGQGPGRGRPRHVPLLGRRDPGRRPRGTDPEADHRRAEVLLDLQLPGPHLRRRRRHRLAGRRRGHLQPGPAVPVVLRSVRPGDDPHLQGGVVPPAAGLRAADDHDARHRQPARDGPGRDQPVVVAVADDVRPARRAVARTPPSPCAGGSSGTPTTSCGSGSST